MIRFLIAARHNKNANEINTYGHFLLAVTAFTQINLQHGNNSIIADVTRFRVLIQKYILYHVISQLLELEHIFYIKILVENINHSESKNHPDY